MQLSVSKHHKKFDFIKFLSIGIEIKQEPSICFETPWAGNEKSSVAFSAVGLSAVLENEAGWET